MNTRPHLRIFLIICVISTAIIFQTSCKRQKHTISKEYPDMAYKIDVALEIPDTVPFAVQYALFQHDPLKSFNQLLKRNKEDILANRSDYQPAIFWDMIFKEIEGDQVSFITNRPGDIHYLSGNFELKDAWIATKISYLHKAPVCWAVPVTLVQDTGKVLLNKENMLDIKTIFNEGIK